MSDPSEQSVIEQVTEAIADVEETDRNSLNISLYNHISTDAIQDLVTHQSNAWRLQFETQNHVVEITGNDVILVDGQQIREFA
jgi:lipopolysaccharide export system protein LptA